MKTSTSTLILDRLGKTRERLANFAQGQIIELKNGNWPVFLRKCKTVLLTIPALLVVIIVRLLRPFIMIRFAPLNSDRIGSFVLFIDLYLYERDLGIADRNTFDIFYHTPPICNHQLKKMLEPHIRIFKFYKFANRVQYVNRLLPGGEKHVVPLPERDIRNLRSVSSEHLFFSPEEERFGLDEKQRIGMPDGAPFVCFYSRDPNYLKVIHPSSDSSYLNYRDADIVNCIPAVLELTNRGYFAVRMGVFVKDHLETANSKIIDYAQKYRTEFLDIYLLAKCHFFLCTPSGIAEIPEAFRRPIVWMNCIPLEYIVSWNPHDLIIPKKLWLKKEHRFLTFREILQSEIGRFQETRLYEESRIEIIQNTPEEITDLVIEMDERLKGTWETNREDEELQQRFWSLFKGSPLHGGIKARIGAEFLRQNRELLK